MSSSSSIPKKTLAIFGATGQQGRALIAHVLADPLLSSQYSIRAITRDVSSPASQSLLQSHPSISLVSADVTSPSTLLPALTSVHTVFAMTVPSFGPNAVESEFSQAKAIADTCVAASVQYLIFSTLPSVSAISNGKYTKCTAFDAKFKAEEYIRSLPGIKSSFYAPAFFMQNFYTQPFLAPRLSADSSPDSDGGPKTWELVRFNAPQSKLPFVDAIGDGGKFVAAILADPEKYQGKTFCAAQGSYTLTEIAELLSKATGEKVVYKQVSVEEFKRGLGLPDEIADVFIDGLAANEEFGYYGDGSEEKMQWARDNMRDLPSKKGLISLEEYFRENPFKLGASDGWKGA